MRELLRFHQQDIVDRVVLQLRTQPSLQPSSIPEYLPASYYPCANTQSALYYYLHGTHASPANPTLIQIAELETQLAELCAANQREQPLPKSRAPGTSNPPQSLISNDSESTSHMVDSVETLFPGVEHSILVQIIQTRFKPRKSYCRLACRKERAESHQIINIGGVEFEQPE